MQYDLCYYLNMIIKFKNFTKLNSEEKKLVLTWRNSDRIRLKMINKDIISLENHLKFIESLNFRKDCEYYLFFVDGIPIGVIDYTNINENNSCELGSYLGNTDYQKYSILILYYQLYFYFKKNPNSKAYSTILKSNKEVYQINKRILLAKDLYDDDEKYVMYFEKKSFEKLTQIIMKQNLFLFDIKHIEIETDNSSPANTHEGGGELQ